uniref:ATP synthase F0 subunit 8 n=1 Tax=Arcotheres purpureus TaxID=2921216 RepID=UPI00202950FF|nr:ATP synthase F0 subunit 8 [Arcotheres purpureus]UPL64937.1 ATP synthase F0 subunit 8 [Arcotheres purpureus]
MPQMAPLYWLYLFCFFLITLFMFLVLNYFLTPYSKMTLTPLKLYNNYKNWKL